MSLLRSSIVGHLRVSIAGLLRFTLAIVLGARFCFVLEAVPRQIFAPEAGGSGKV